MNGSLKLLCLSLIVFASAFAVEQLLVPDVVPIAWSDGPQPSWKVQLAFLLSATENVAGFCAILAVFVAGASYLDAT